MYQSITNFQNQIHTALAHYFQTNHEQAETVRSEWLQSLLPHHSITAAEQTILLLALMPHISPQTLDLFFVQNKDLDRPYTEFGGWKGLSHGGFLPTGQTAQFLIENTSDTPLSLRHLLSREHWFYTENIVHLEGQSDGEPFLSGRLVVSEEFLATVHGKKFEPEYSADFPVRRITTPLEWSDLILPYNLHEELNNIMCWIHHWHEILKNKQLNRIIKPGYRCLFYGPPGTGKTLTAKLIGKQNGIDVYRVDLSMIVSKYIGETEKNLARIFDKAEHQNWILFFDEADALFGQRSETQSSNDRHANQEVAYLLQRIENFPGIVILATNLKGNIDEAFFRRFQSSVYFPMPDETMRRTLWHTMLPTEWIAESNEIIETASKYELSGGNIVNVIQTCAIQLYKQSTPILTPEIVEEAIAKELMKEGVRAIKA
ncbi:MAG: AAA family ATPase [Bacteroidales bacterium]|jgi:adenylate kinase family enzyme|nr:AAA family ATPase [Bacteroidales bacterium]